MYTSKPYGNLKANDRRTGRQTDRHTTENITLSQLRSQAVKVLLFDSQQECIPVGCVPAARRPYSGILESASQWGYPRSGRGGVLPGPGGRGVLPDLEGSPRSRGGSAWSGGVSLVRGVLPGLGGSHWSRGGVLPGPVGDLPGPGEEGSPWQTPPVNRMTDRRKNITLAPTSLRPVKIVSFNNRREAAVSCSPCGCGFSIAPS